MIYDVFSVRDSKTDFFPPQMHASVGDAKRSLAMTVNTPGNMVSFSPKDFDLFRVATFNSQTGEVAPVFPAEFVCSASSLIKEV